jgi:hypothetical protein
MSDLISTRAKRLAMTSQNSSLLRKELMVDAKSAPGQHSPQVLPVISGEPRRVGSHTGGLCECFGNFGSILSHG